MGNGFNEYKMLIDKHLESHDGEIEENRSDHKEINDKLDKVIIGLAEMRARARLINTIFGLIAGTVSAIIVSFFKKN
jgi:hypothetical protein